MSVPKVRTFYLLYVLVWVANALGYCYYIEVKSETTEDPKMKTATCNRCNRQIDTRGLSGHQGSMACYANRQANAAEAAGLVQAPSGMLVAEVRKAGGEPQYFETRYVAGGSGRRAKATRQLWITTEVAVKIALQGAVAGTPDWRPSEVIPEDYYA